MSSKYFFSLSSVKRCMEDASPGSLDSDAVKHMREHLEDHVRKLIPYARKIAHSAGRKRIKLKDLRAVLEMMVKP